MSSRLAGGACVDDGKEQVLADIEAWIDARIPPGVSQTLIEETSNTGARTPAEPRC